MLALQVIVLIAEITVYSTFLVHSGLEILYDIITAIYNMQCHDILCCMLKITVGALVSIKRRS